MTTPSGTTGYTFDAADRLTQAGSTTYSYDANGNLTGRGADTFGWDSADRLTSGTVAGTAATMSYDGSSNLVSKTVAGSTTRYVYDRNLPLPQLLTAGDTTYQYGPGMAAGFGPMMQEAAGTKSWLHDDALGSIRFTTNSAGASVGSSTYDAFGTQRATSGQQNLFRFAGQEQHADIGLIHMRARWYDPAIGRFISRKPVRGSAAAPESLNSYAYARNNPCNLRDPSGRTPSMSASSSQSGAARVLALGLGQATRGTALGIAVFGPAGGSTCFAAESYKPVMFWKDPPQFNDPGGNLISRFAAYWAWVDALYAWSDQMLAAWKNGPSYTKVAGYSACGQEVTDVEVEGAPDQGAGATGCPLEISLDEIPPVLTRGPILTPHGRPTWILPNGDRIVDEEQDWYVVQPRDGRAFTVYENYQDGWELLFLYLTGAQAFVPAQWENHWARANTVW